ncbi:hypothetical protein ACIOHE_13255 [Streptomyces sp. NPDC087851]|uniref:hypothetical protein n=1 Tax=Streptomyces sp. NPDC087851 TaxID=3365810 RepID=UPI00380B22C9
MSNGPENELSGRTDGEAAEVTAETEQAEEPDEPAKSAKSAKSERSGQSEEPDDAGTDLSGDLAGALDGDELALRRLMHGAVGELRPSDGALDHLRKAVPTRRARKRQAVVGVAAAALLVGTAVPAFVHVANTGTMSDDHSVAAGHGEKSRSGEDTDRTDKSRTTNPDGPSDKVSADEDEPDKQEKPDPDASDAADGGKGGTSDASGGSSSVTSSQVCTAGQLRQPTAEVGGADAMGKVYGTFRLANVSSSACTVTGRGSIGFGTMGAADGSKISTSTHFAGDAATGLPDPSQEMATLTLPPNGTYQVKFAWVPSETCPTSGGPSPDPSPTDDGSAGTTTGSTAGTGETGSGDGTTGAEPQLLNDGGIEDGSVSVSYTAAAGTTVSATIPNACAGTVYWTGLLSGF